jgi:leucyl aminopeptidase (aminopeptidase T)
MHDARFDKLAKLLVEYSTRLKRNENVLIEAFDVPDEMTIALVRTARKAGAKVPRDVYDDCCNQSRVSLNVSLRVASLLSRQKRKAMTSSTPPPTIASYC